MRIRRSRDCAAEISETAAIKPSTTTLSKSSPCSACQSSTASSAARHATSPWSITTSPNSRCRSWNRSSNAVSPIPVSPFPSQQQFRQNVSPQYDRVWRPCSASPGTCSHRRAVGSTPSSRMRRWSGDSLARSPPPISTAPAPWGLPRVPFDRTAARRAMNLQATQPPAITARGIIPWPRLPKALLASEEGYDPIEDRPRAMVRQTIEVMFEEELAEAMGRAHYARSGKAKGYRNGRRERELVGTFGTEAVRVPRARIEGADGRVCEWRSTALPRYRRLQRVRRKRKQHWALFPDERGADRIGLPVGHEHAPVQAGLVRAFRKRRPQRRGQPGLAQGEGGLGHGARSLAEEDIVRPMLDDTVVHTRIDKRHEQVGSGGDRSAPMRCSPSLDRRKMAFSGGRAGKAQ